MPRPLCAPALTHAPGRPAANDPPPAFAPALHGAEFFFAGHGRHAHTGLLLVHGLTGTPAEMRPLGRTLAGHGFAVLGVQLAGHCAGTDELLATRWTDWAASVEHGARRLAAGVDRVLVIGLSMGAVLALELAARPEWAGRLAGVVALSTTFRHDGWAMPVYTRLAVLMRPLRALGIGRRRVFMEQPPYGIKDESLRARVVAQMHGGDSAAAGLPGNPWWSVVEMQALAAHVQRRLPAVQAPCLVLHAAHDDIASARNARRVCQRVGGPAELVLFHDSYHMLTIDRERREVSARIAEFCVRASAAAAP